MSRKKKDKHKIVIPSEDEVSEYGGEAGSNPEPNPSADEAAGTDAEGSQPASGEAEQWRDRFLRAKAELANYQKRAERDRADNLRYANARLVQALLPVLDDLERIVTAGADQAGDATAVTDGVKLTLENFLKVLRDFDVERIEAQGQPFDPAVHEAMMQQPSDEHEVATVLQEVAKGYRLQDRVLRPSRVIVSKPLEEQSNSADDAEEDAEED